MIRLLLRSMQTASSMLFLPDVWWSGATSVSAPAIFAEITVEVGHTVRFESAETVQIEEQLVADGAYAVKPEDPPEAGYGFEGWYREPEASEAFDFTQPIHADTVIYLKWTSLPQDVPMRRSVNGSGLDPRHHKRRQRHELQRCDKQRLVL